MNRAKMFHTESDSMPSPQRGARASLLAALRCLGFAGVLLGICLLSLAASTTASAQSGFGISNPFGASAEEQRQKKVAECISEQRRHRMQVASKAGHYVKLSKQEEIEVMNLCTAMYPPPEQPAKN